MPGDLILCSCGMDYFDETRYSSCYSCFVRRVANLVVCIQCGVRRHNPAYPTCLHCRRKAPHRQEAATALRQLIHARDDFTCQVCGVREGELQHVRDNALPQPATMEVDHIVPCRRGGNAEEWNLQLLCGVHNQRKGQAWWFGCLWEQVKTNLCRRYFLTPRYFDAETHARFRREVAFWRATGTWDPTTWRQYEGSTTLLEEVAL